MSSQQRVSRRSSLKNLGAMGAAAILGGATAAPLAAAEPDAHKTKSKDVADPADLALARFAKGHSCAQAVFSAFAERMGMDYQTAVKLTSGFGGGMGMGSVCGAVTGGLMAIGLKFGGVDPKTKEQTSRLARELVQRFKTQHRTVICRELLGLDPTTPEGRRTMQEKNLRSTVCNVAIRDAANLVQELLAR
jgi:C_GCAxxG_C_C family probable redox protein